MYCIYLIIYVFGSLKQRAISFFYLGFLKLGVMPGCVGEKDGRKTGKQSQRACSGGRGMGGTGVRRGVMECSGLERQAN